MHRCFVAQVCVMGVVLGSLVGCGGASNERNLQAVSGTIRLAGAALPDGRIEFSPVESGGLSSGATISEGKYTIPADKGLPPGDYIIRISSAGADSEEAPDMPGEAKLKQELIPAEFNAQSQERRTVKAGEKNVFDFEIPAAAR